jgi:hypothetical protein
MTTEQALRIKALELAVGVPGNPNHVQQATSFLDFIKAGDKAHPPVEAPQEATEDTTTTNARKGTRK